LIVYHPRLLLTSQVSQIEARALRRGPEAATVGALYVDRSKWLKRDRL
jgi:hypothetical protein